MIYTSIGFIFVILNIIFTMLGITIGQQKGLNNISIIWLGILGFLIGPFIIFTYFIESKIKHRRCLNCNAEFKTQKNITKGICPNCKKPFEIKEKIEETTSWTME